GPTPEGLCADLARCGPAGVARLVELLDYPYSGTRAGAAAALAAEAVRNPAVVPPLAARLGDGSEDVRLAALTSLRAAGPNAAPAAGAVRRLLADPDPAVRAAAAAT